MNSRGLVLLEHANLVLLHPRSVGAYGARLEEANAVEVLDGIEAGLGVAVGNFLARFTHVNVQTSAALFGQLRGAAQGVFAAQIDRMRGDGVLHQVVFVVGCQQAIEFLERRCRIGMTGKGGIADRSTDESTKSSLGQNLARHAGIEVHVRSKTAPGANHLGRRTTAAHANVIGRDAGFGWEDGFVQPSVERKTVAEVSCVQLHGQMRVPVLETAGDQPLGAVDVLHHVFVAVGR